MIGFSIGSLLSSVSLIHSSTATIPVGRNAEKSGTTERQIDATKFAFCPFRGVPSGIAAMGRWNSAKPVRAGLCRSPRDGVAAKADFSNFLRNVAPDFLQYISGIQSREGQNNERNFEL